METYNKYIFIIILILAAISCKEQIEALNKSQEEVDYTLVRVAEIEKGVGAPSIKAIGKVASDTEVKLSFKIGGVIATMNAREGAYVKKGSVLATIRTNEIDAQVLKAERALQKARRDLERIRQMYSDSVATLENVQDLETLVDVSEADLNIAQFNQQYARIIAPVSGRILKRIAEPNELVSPGQPLYILASSGQGSYIMKAALSDRDISRINYQDQVKLFFDAFPRDTFTGRILNIAESADPRTGTFDVEISINSKGQRIRNGLIGRILVDPVSNPKYLRIPYDAIAEADDNKLTFYSPVQGDSIALRWESVAEHVETDYILIEDEEELYHSRVITAGAPYLKNGAKIKIQK